MFVSLKHSHSLIITTTDIAAPTSGPVAPSEGDTDITSIIGFAAVLIILVGAIVAVLFLCICYGFCKLNTQQVSVNTTHGRGMVPLPSPRTTQPLHASPAILRATRKSTSFQNTPLAVALNADSPYPAPAPSSSTIKSPNAVNLAQAPSSYLHHSDQNHVTSKSVAIAQHVSVLSQQHTVTAHRVPVSLELQSLHNGTPVTPVAVSLELQSLHVDVPVPLNRPRPDASGPASFPKHCGTPKSASGDLREDRTVSAMACRMDMNKSKLLHSFSTEV